MTLLYLYDNKKNVLWSRVGDALEQEIQCNVDQGLVGQCYSKKYN